MANDQTEGTEMDEREQAADRELGDLIRTGATRHAPAAALRERLATAIRNQDVSDARTPRVSRASWWPVGVAFACGALLSWIASSLLSGADAGRRVDGEVVNAHVRAVMMERATG